MPLPGALTSIVDKVGSVVGGGKLVKAVMYASDGPMTEPIPVQFNPSEYSIQRGVKMSTNTGAGKEGKPSDNQIVQGEQAVLSLTLYFDGYSELVKAGGLMGKVSSMAGGVMGKLTGSAPKTEPPDPEAEPEPNPEVNALCDALLRMIKFEHTIHEPPVVHFVWGNQLHFIGNINSSTVQYTAFAKDGTPVRATIQLEIVGEEMRIIKEMLEKTEASPDRTKQRLLPYGDQMWMMAEEEYGDPSKWKVIAEANEILNPRALRGAVRLKVPSIR